MPPSAYLESAEILLRREDQAAAETALKKAAELDPKNSKIQILRARVAIARQEPEEAERIINSSPELQSDPAGKRILLDSYLGTRKLPEAEKLVRGGFPRKSRGLRAGLQSFLRSWWKKGTLTKRISCSRAWRSRSLVRTMLVLWWKPSAGFGQMAPISTFPPWN